MKCLSLSEEAPWGAWEEASSLGTLEDMLRKSLDEGIPPCGDPFIVGKPDMGGGEGARIPRIWIDE
jgi:hypothetical protein